MQPFEPEICQLVETLWSSILGMMVEPIPETPDRLAEQDGWHWGGVAIAGAWNGMVVLGCMSDLARRAAGSMFGMSTDETTPEQVCDVLGELANITGGNFKSLLPDSCTLSLPIVASGPLPSVEGRHVLTHLGFVCDEMKLTVTVLEDSTG